MKNQKNIQFIKKILISLIVIIVIGTCISIFIINEKRNSDLKGIESKASTTTIGSGTFVTDTDHNSEISNISSNSSVVYDLGVGQSFNVSSIPGYKNFTSKNFMIDWVNSVDSTTTYLGDSENASSAGCFYYTYCYTHLFRKGYSASTGILTACNVTDPGNGNVTYANVHVYLVIDKTKLKTQ